jgi:hypothetical protein
LTLWRYSKDNFSDKDNSSMEAASACGADLMNGVMALVFGGIGKSAGYQNCGTAGHSPL